MNRTISRPRHNRKPGIMRTYMEYRAIIMGVLEGILGHGGARKSL